MSEAFKLRLALSRAVRPLWGTEEAFHFRDELSKKLSDYAKCLYDAARAGRPITDAYEECARRYNVREVLKSAWGKR